MSASITNLFSYYLFSPGTRQIKGFFCPYEAGEEKKRLNVQELKKHIEGGEYLSDSEPSRAEVFSLKELKIYAERYEVDIAEIIRGLQCD